MTEEIAKPRSRWILFNWKNARRVLIAGAVLITLVAVFFTVVNWRGQRAWKAFIADMKQRGEPLTIEELVPPLPPDADNFAAIPLLKPLLDYRHEPGPNGGSNVWNQPENYRRLLSLSLVKHPPKKASADHYQQRGTDFAKWQSAFRNDTNCLDPTLPLSPATTVTNRETGKTEYRYDTNHAVAEVLLALRRFDPDMDALHAAADRKHIHFPVHYEEGFAALLPHMQVMRHFARVAQLRAAAALTQQRPTDAWRELQLIIRMSEAADREPILISQLVRVALLTIATEGIWEGMAGGKWSDGQLREIERRLRPVDMVRQYSLSIRGERILALRALDLVRNQLEAVGMNDEMAMGALFRHGPSGWYQLNLARFGRMFDEFILPFADVEKRRLHLVEGQAKARELSQRFSRFHLDEVLAKLLLPAYEKVLLRFADCQVTLDHVRIACAIERFRREHGALPSRLDEITPLLDGAAPKDPTNGEDYRYKVAEDGKSYRLWSPGADGKDDGGRIEWREEKSGERDHARGDWVWQG